MFGLYLIYLQYYRIARQMALQRTHPEKVAELKAKVISVFVLKGVLFKY